MAETASYSAISPNVVITSEVNNDPAWLNTQLVVPAPKINSWAAVVVANPLLTTVSLPLVPLALGRDVQLRAWA